MNIQMLLQSAASFLNPMALPSLSPQTNWRIEAEILLAYVLNVSRAYLHTWPEQVVREAEKEQFESLFTKRREGEPIAYLVGSKEFWSLPFTVSPAVLIPRPETEYLVEEALKQMENQNGSIRVLDLGTGSGAIALALAVERPHWEIVAIDKSHAALNVALSNAKNLTVENVRFYQSDWFSYFCCSSKKLFNLIVANPPYLAPHEMCFTDCSIQYEPKEALISPPDGLEDLRRIIIEAPSYLIPKGWLMVEHGFNQSATVQSLMQTNGFIEIKSIKDLAGLNRITIGLYPQ